MFVGVFRKPPPTFLLARLSIEVISISLRVFSQSTILAKKRVFRRSGHFGAK